MLQVVQPKWVAYCFAIAAAFGLSGCSNLEMPTFHSVFEAEEDVVTMRDGHVVLVPNGYCAQPSLEKHDSSHSLIVLSPCSDRGGSALGDLVLTVSTNGRASEILTPDAKRALFSGRAAEDIITVDNRVVARLERSLDNGKSENFWRAFEARDGYLLMASLIPRQGKLPVDTRAKAQLIKMLKSVSLVEPTEIIVTEIFSDQTEIPRPVARP